MLNSNEAPLSPYRVIWELMNTVDGKNTIITHERGSPRDQISPFWVSTEPMSYIGWGKTTQLGMGLGLAMGAKLAKRRSCASTFGGDAAIGFTGMDFETCVRGADSDPVDLAEQLLHGDRAEGDCRVSTEKYRSTDISGDYAAMAAGVRGIRGAGDSAGGYQGGDPAGDRADAEGRAGAAGVHYSEGDAGFQVLRGGGLRRRPHPHLKMLGRGRGQSRPRYFRRNRRRGRIRLRVTTNRVPRLLVSPATGPCSRASLTAPDSSAGCRMPSLRESGSAATKTKARDSLR